MKKALYKLIKPLLNRAGIDVIRYQSSDSCPSLPPAFDDSVIDIIQKVQPFTQTSVERLSALYEAIKYIIAN